MQPIYNAKTIPQYRNSELLITSFQQNVYVNQKLMMEGGVGNEM